MRYVVGFMMVAFFLVGAGLFGAGVRGLMRRFAARHRLKQAEGEIVRIEVRQETVGSEDAETVVYHHPHIRFRQEHGGDTTFVSEFGAGARAKRYAVGQKIAVLYDPDGEIAPTIHSWAGSWGPNLVRTIAGPVFIGGAVLIYWAFGDKIMGR